MKFIHCQIIFTSKVTLVIEFFHGKYFLLRSLLASLTSDALGATFSLFVDYPHANFSRTYLVKMSMEEVILSHLIELLIIPIAILTIRFLRTVEPTTILGTTYNPFR